MPQIKVINNAYHSNHNNMNYNNFKPQSPPDLPYSYISPLTDDLNIKEIAKGKTKPWYNKKQSHLFRKASNFDIDKDSTYSKDNHSARNLLDENPHKMNKNFRRHIYPKKNNEFPSNEIGEATSLNNITNTDSSSNDTFINGNVTNKETKPIFPNINKDKSYITSDQPDKKKYLKNIEGKYTTSSLSEDLYSVIPKNIQNWKRHDMKQIKKILADLKKNKEKVVKTLTKLTVEFSKWEETLDTLDPDVSELTREFKFLFHDEMMSERLLTNSYNTMEIAFTNVMNRESEYNNFAKQITEANKNLQKIINKEGYNSEEYIFEKEKRESMNNSLLVKRNHYQESILCNMRKNLMDHTQIKLNCFSKSKEIGTEILMNSLIKLKNSETDNYHNLLKQIKNNYSANNESKNNDNLEIFLNKLEVKVSKDYKDTDASNNENKKAFQDEYYLANLSYNDSRLKTLEQSPITGNKFLRGGFNNRESNENGTTPTKNPNKDVIISKKKSIEDPVGNSKNIVVKNEILASSNENLESFIDGFSNLRDKENASGILFNIGDDQNKVDLEDESEVENNKWA
ncbi:hypothetical protein TPHA_0H01250 [Tetrapisispora phaffii CBS 4417]|uniref:Uncharacterized protein n=1 Tax=Tetrapisispora phaffii (strain ATCC 24235 / CBS 4417 / NBRC 1672 / NRRL Y-8282 / UCD 70-5) TaxID=1071381 RepID=G8BX29_TETPH|nr:hypothetical protein TPHA_0H01250 [Tetrapisispora phaffii CBS 4417]CCE64333.1 hypothetical protein TPHA_0H01250 [Tetrapisispora phaffii CBS 4417]